MFFVLNYTIFLVWFFYFFTVVVSTIIGLIAIDFGAIDGDGSFEGEHGEYLNQLIGISLDIGVSFKIISAVICIIIVPQLFSYLFSGFYGVAKYPVFLGESWSLLVWWIVKTFVVVAGVVTVIPTFGAVLAWESFSLKQIVGWYILAVSFCNFSFGVLVIYREIEEVVDDAGRFIPARVISVFSAAHRWFVRNIN